ncbi:MAG: hypothetical protein WBC93_06255 [Sulfitobacter sp.]
MNRPNHADELVKKLKAALESGGQPHVFDSQEVEEIQQVLEFFRMIRQWKKLGNLILWAVLTAGLVLSNLDRIKEMFK